MMRYPGFHEARDGELIELLFVREEDGTTYRGSLLSPTTEEMISAISENGLPVVYTLNMIRSRNSGVHTILIDVNQFKKHLREEGVPFED